MSRLQKAFRGIATGYLLMGVNIVYTMASIPLALKYLSTEQFGLWALVSQLAGYMQLMDLGMSGAVARILGDYKDDRDGGAYGSVLKTGALVFLIQGIALAAVGTVLAITLSGIAGVPIHLQREFRFLMIGQSLLLAASLATRAIGSPLWCHQRQDVVNLTSILMFVVSFAALWMGFARGMGIYSLLLAGVSGLVLSVLVVLPISCRLGVYPAAGCWGRITRTRFRELFDFAGSFFLLQLGTQLVGASQIVIISKTLGLETAAAWAVGTKIFTLAQQAVAKIFEGAAPGFSEMFVRGERELLRTRFRQVVEITGSLAVFVAIVGASLNSPFVTLWTHGKVAWSPTYDALMAISTILVAITRCHTGLVGISKEIRGMRYIYLAEGILFVGLSVFLAPRWGISGVLYSAIGANLLCSGWYGFYRTAAEFNTSILEPAFLWNRRFLVVAAFGVALSGCAVWEGSRRSLTQLDLLAGGIALAAISAALLWFIGLGPQLRRQLTEKIRNRSLI